MEHSTSRQPDRLTFQANLVEKLHETFIIIVYFTQRLLLKTPANSISSQRDLEHPGTIVLGYLTSTLKQP